MNQAYLCMPVFFKLAAVSRTVNGKYIQLKV